MQDEPMVIADILPELVSAQRKWEKSCLYWDYIEELTFREKLAIKAALKWAVAEATQRKDAK